MTWTTQTYCTSADVIAALDPNVTFSAADQTWIAALISEAQATLDREIGYMFQQDGTASTPATRLYDGGLSGDVRGSAMDSMELFIDDMLSLYGGGGCTPTPCGAVFETTLTTFLSAGGFWVTGATITTDITADILTKPNNAIANNVPIRKLVRNSGLSFASGHNNYKVLGIFGQPILAGQVYPGVPNDIMRACIRLAVHYYKMRDTNYSDMMQEQGGIRERYTKTIPLDVMEIIKRYRKPLFLGRSS